MPYNQFEMYCYLCKICRKRHVEIIKRIVKVVTFAGFKKQPFYVVKIREVYHNSS